MVVLGLRLRWTTQRDSIARHPAAIGYPSSSNTRSDALTTRNLMRPAIGLQSRCLMTACDSHELAVGRYHRPP